MNENEVFRFKVRIAIPNLSRENKGWKKLRTL